MAVVLLFAILNLPLSASRRLKGVVREAVSPLQDVVSSFSFRIKEAGRALRGLGGLARENREMSAELIRLRQRVGELVLVERENFELRSQLNFGRRSGLNLICCEVIGRDLSGWWETVRIGQGHTDGVYEKQAVVTPDGLVGKTMDVSPHTADVFLISDPKCRVSARIRRTGAFGVVAGRGVAWNGNAGCRMDFINANIAVRPGDEVVTSGLGGVFPKGLVIGYVEKAYRDASGLYQYADIVPKADLGRLSYVFVVSHDSPSVMSILGERRETTGGAP